MFSMDAVPPAPFALSLSFDLPSVLSLPFDKLRTIGNTNEPNTKPTPFGLSPSFDKLRMIGNTNAPNTNPTPFGLSLPFDRLRTIGNTKEPNTNPTPFGLSLSKPCHQSRGTSTGSGCTGTSTSSVRTGSFFSLKFLAFHP